MSPQAPIKILHVWLAVASVVFTMAVGIFKIGQWSGDATRQLESINGTVQGLSVELKAVAAQAREAEVNNSRQDEAIRALQGLRGRIFDK